MTLESKCRYGSPGATLAAILCASALAVATVGGCKNQEAPPENLKPIAVGPVELYGMNLGPQASPQEVTFALMQALRETVQASQAHHERDKRAAVKRLVETELQLCAPARIYRNVNPAAPETVAPEERDSVVYRIVKFWAPIAARYVDCFSPDSEKMMSAMRIKRLGETDARVSYDVTDPVDQTKVTFQVFLTLERGTEPAHSNERFWRVYRLGYAAFGHDDGAPAPVQTRPATTRAVP